METIHGAANSGHILFRFFFRVGMQHIFEVVEEPCQVRYG